MNCRSVGSFCVGVWDLSELCPFAFFFFKTQSSKLEFFFSFGMDMD